MESNDLNRAIVTNPEGESFEVLFNMRESDFLLLTELWIEGNSDFKASNLSMWLFLSIMDNSIGEFFDLDNCRHWFIIPADKKCLLKPIIYDNTKGICP
jgi:hypothetical protein